LLVVLCADNDAPPLNDTDSLSTAAQLSYAIALGPGRSRD
jgi:hypothetical protein